MLWQLGITISCLTSHSELMLARLRGPALVPLGTQHALSQCIASISKIVTSTAIWSKLLIVYAYIRTNFMEIPNGCWVKSTWNKHDLYRKFSIFTESISWGNYINPSYGLSLVDTLWNASSYRQPLEQEGNPMTKIEKLWLQISLIVAKKS